MTTNAVSSAVTAEPEQPLRPLDRVARQILIGQRLQHLTGGCVLLRDAEGSTVLGDDGGECRAEVVVHRSRFFRRALLGGSIGAGAAYIDGDWDCDDLCALFRLLLRSEQAMERLEGGPARMMNALQYGGHLLRRNTRNGSRRNISDHYDLGNDFFRLFLDETMTYSAATFDPPGLDLERAQAAKLDRICRKLDLQPGHEVLEIGTGWGSFALHAARNYGCHVTTTTISREQYELARARVEAEGLADRVTLLMEDYRNLEGHYDRLVSIEMIEAVGHEHLDTFFGICNARLRDHGRMALQSITAGDRWYGRYRRSVDFIQHYIFPGGVCPSLGAISAALGRASDLRITQVEDLTEDYAETLRHWRQRFRDRADSVLALGYPERFLRLWDFYLQYCEAGFAERHTGTLQIVLDKPRCDALPIRPRLTENPA